MCRSWGGRGVGIKSVEAWETERGMCKSGLECHGRDPRSPHGFWLLHRVWAEGSHPKGSQGLSGVYPKPHACQTPARYLGTSLGLSDAGDLEEAASEVLPWSEEEEGTIQSFG